MVRNDVTAQEVICISTDPGQGHIARSGASRAIWPEGYMAQFCPLEFVDRVHVAKANGVVCDVATWDVVVGNGVHAQHLGRLCFHDDRTPSRIEAVDGGCHAVDEVVSFVHIAGEPAAQAFVQQQVQRLRAVVLDGARLLIVVVGVTLPIGRNASKGRAASALEEHLWARALTSAAPLRLHVITVVSPSIISRRPWMSSAVGRWCLDQAL